MTRKIKAVIFIVILLYASALSTFSYAYLWPRIRVISYLVKIDPLIEATQQAYDIGQTFGRLESSSELTDEPSIKKWGKEVDEGAEKIDKMLPVIEKGLHQAKRISPPPECKSLHKWMSENLEDSVANIKQIKLIVQYYAKFDSVLIDWGRIQEAGNAISSTDDADAVLSKSKNVKNLLDSSVYKLNAIQPPKICEKVHNDYIEMFGLLSDAYADLIAGLKTNNLSRINASEQKINQSDAVEKQLKKNQKVLDDKLDEMIEEEEKQVDRINRQLERTRSKYIPFSRYIKDF